MSLRWKIALALAAVALVATTAVGVIGYRTTRDRLLAEVDQSMNQAAAIVVQRAGQGIPQRGPLAVYSVQAVDSGGKVRTSTFGEVVEPDETASQAVGNPDVVVHQSVDIAGEPHRVLTIGVASGAVQVARPLDETERVLEGIRSRTVLLVVLVSLGAAILGWLIASGVVRPLQRLTRTARGVESTGHLDVVADLPTGGGDEVTTLSAAFRSMLDALRRSRDAQQRLVQDAGHELRTPLTSLRTNLSVLRRHPDLPEDTKERILEDLDSEAVELANLVDELVAAASGRLHDEPPAEVELADVARQVADRAARRHERRIDVSVESSAVVLAPPNGVERAVVNLVDNACKFDDGDGPIEILVDGGALRVADRGPGIAEADLPSVFDRFHRAESARAMPGSGLGLSIVRDVVERSGGTVVASNRPGGGAEVGFDLPVA